MPKNFVILIYFITFVPIKTKKANSQNEQRSYNEQFRGSTTTESSV